jgi:hypothetical protein
MKRTGEHLAGADASGGRGVQIGDSGVQFNYFAAEAGAAGLGSVVAGDVPQEPAAFQSRAGLMEALGRESGGRLRVVFAVTGARGVGKTQTAAAYARTRIAEGWRLVAWVDASDETSALAGLAQVAVAAGVGPDGEDARVLAVRGLVVETAVPEPDRLVRSQARLIRR